MTDARPRDFHTNPVSDREAELTRALQGAVHALRSYQYGNGALGLAAAIADHLEPLIAATWAPAMPPLFTLPWAVRPLPIDGAPQTGEAFLALGRHGPHIVRAARGVQEGDDWWAIAQWDHWREPHQFVFCLDGSPLWEGALSWMPLPSWESPL